MGVVWLVSVVLPRGEHLVERLHQRGQQLAQLDLLLTASVLQVLCQRPHSRLHSHTRHRALTHRRRQGLACAERDAAAAATPTGW